MTESIQSHPLHAIDREHVDRWLVREELYRRVRSLWTSGFRPGRAVDDAVGSGFDTTENDAG